MSQREIILKSGDKELKCIVFDDNKAEIHIKSSTYEFRWIPLNENDLKKLLDFLANDDRI